MGTKVEALRHIADSGGATPISNLAVRLLDQLPLPKSDDEPDGIDLSGEDQDAFANALLDIDEYKEIVKLANEAANELKDQIASALYDLMVANERTKFDKRGKLFYLTSQNFVQADKEQGGTKNPALIEWLNDNGMEALTAVSVNANALRGAVNKWLEDHDLETDDYTEEEVFELFDDEVEFESYEAVDGSIVTVAQQLAWRDHQRQLYCQEKQIEAEEFEDGSVASPVEVVQDIIERKRELLGMVKITQKPIVGVKSA